MFGTCKKRVLHGILILKIREQANGYCCTQYLLVQLKKKNLFKLERKHKTANVNIHLIAVWVLFQRHVKSLLFLIFNFTATLMYKQ